MSLTHTDEPVRVPPPKRPVRDFESELNPTIYHERWWLDIASKNTAEEVEISHDGAVIARLPFIPTQHLGMTIFGLPSFVHFLGPSFAGLEGPPMHQMQRRHDLTRELIGKLPPFDYFWQKCHADLEDALGFQVSGFKASVQFNFEIEPKPANEALSAIRRGHRKLIREAKGLYTVEDIDPDTFVDLYRRNIAAEGREFAYDAERLNRLAAETLTRGKGRLLAARDETGLKAGLLILWDHSRLYYFLGTRPREKGEARPSILLVWRAIEEACDRNLIFDFDGVFNAGQVMFYSGFGGRVSPRYIVSRSSRRAQVVNGIGAVLRRGRRAEHVF